jgi:predicted SAM-dependent methyltransferase
MSSFVNKLMARFAPTDKALLMVNLGCGKAFHPAWVNVDFIATRPEVQPHDLREPLPFADQSCSVVYHSHVLEHFPRAYAPVFLRECWRILASGGLIRVVVPDLEMIARLYLRYLEAAAAGDVAAEERYDWMTLELMDQMVREKSGGDMNTHWRQQPIPAADFIRERMGQEFDRFMNRKRKANENPPPEITTYPHADPAAVAQFRETGEIHRWMYDRVSLARLLTRAGFVESRVCAAHESAIPNFADYHLDVEESGEIRKPDSLFMEARKP